MGRILSLFGLTHRSEVNCSKSGICCQMGSVRSARAAENDKQLVLRWVLAAGPR